MPELLHQRLKQIVIDTLQLDAVTAEDLADDEPLMDSEMGLDSIDALELVVQVEKEFGIKIKTSEAAREALRSIDSLARYIETATD